MHTCLNTESIMSLTITSHATLNKSLNNAGLFPWYIKQNLDTIYKVPVTSIYYLWVNNFSSK